MTGELGMFLVLHVTPCMHDPQKPKTEGGQVDIGMHAQPCSGAGYVDAAHLQLRRMTKEKSMDVRRLVNRSSSLCMERIGAMP